MNPYSHLDDHSGSGGMCFTPPNKNSAMNSQLIITAASFLILMATSHGAEFDHGGKRSWNVHTGMPTKAVRVLSQVDNAEWNPSYRPLA